MRNMPETINDIQSMINNAIQDSTSLDYKATIKSEGDSKKDWRSEIAKDVSAMANANGGMIIYGVKECPEKEKAIFPEKITPIDALAVSREQLEQIIYQNISPKINGLEILTLPCEDAPNSVVYVVNVPKSETAHQNLVDKNITGG